MCNNGITQLYLPHDTETHTEISTVHWHTIWTVYSRCWWAELWCTWSKSISDKEAAKWSWSENDDRKGWNFCHVSDSCFCCCCLWLYLHSESKIYTVAISLLNFFICPMHSQHWTDYKTRIMFCETCICPILVYPIQPNRSPWTILVQRHPESTALADSCSIERSSCALKQLLAHTHTPINLEQSNIRIINLSWILSFQCLMKCGLCTRVL